GFDCKDRWVYHRSDLHEPPTPRAVIAPGVPGVIPFELLKGTAPSAIRDVGIVAADAASPGGSSIAVLALPGSQADIQYADIRAGNGADGDDGKDGGHDAATAKQGVNGGKGADACTMDVSSGGFETMVECPDGTISFGGQGGNGGEAAANGGGDGLQK